MPNVIVPAEGDDTLDSEQISHFHVEQTVPSSLVSESEDDSLYEEGPVLFRRESGRVRVTIFDGGHAFFVKPSCTWLAERTRSSVRTEYGIPGHHPRAPELLDNSHGGYLVDLRGRYFSSQHTIPDWTPAVQESRVLIRTRSRLRHGYTAP